ncbi:hypothetical protein DNR46_28165, partial [Mesorhizobium japonicum]
MFGTAGGTFSTYAVIFLPTINGYAFGAGGVTLGDFNGDGNLDIATSSFVNHTIEVLQGNGTGGFSAPVAIQYPGQYGDNLVATDVNNDGKLDLVVASYNPSLATDSVGVLLGNGNGTFQPLISSAIPGTSDSEHFGLAVGDINGDGLADVVMSSLSNNSLEIMLGDGQGHFQIKQIIPYNTTGGSYASGVALGDFNHDGKLDLAVADYSGGIKLYQNDGTGNFTFAQTIVPVSGPAAPANNWPGLLAADVNKDGAVDLIETGANSTGIWEFIQSVSNHSPIANADIATTDEDHSKVISVLGNDSDPDTTDHLSVTGASVSSGLGSVTVAADGQTITYNPGSAYNYLAVGEQATVQASYAISDGHGGTSNAAATITVTGVNDGPTASNDVATTDEDHSKVISVLGNDSDPDTTDHLSVTGASVSSGLGSVTVAADGQTITYNPGSAYNYLAVGEQATVQASYAISDGHGGTSNAAATITVTGANDGPTVSAAVSATTSEDAAAYNVNLLQSASDPDSSDVLHVDPASVTGLAAGVTLVGDSLQVDPSAYNALAVAEQAVITVTYNIIDGHGGTVGQTATITVTGANDTPTVSAAVSATTSEDAAAYNVNLLQSASDPDSSDVLHVDPASVTGLAAGVTLVGDSLQVDPSAYNAL